MQQKSEPQDLLHLIDPYKTLGTSQALLDHFDALNALEPEDARALIQRMVLSCPNEEWDEFGKQITFEGSSLNVAQNQESDESEEDNQDFISCLNVAYYVKQSMRTLLDPNKLPHTTLLNTPVDYDAFNEYSALVLIELGKELDFVQRLAQSTPSSERGRVSKIIALMFKDTLIPQKVRAAFELKHNEEQQAQNANSETQTDVIDVDESVSESEEEAYLDATDEPVTESEEEVTPISCESEKKEAIEVNSNPNVLVIENGLFRRKPSENDSPLPTRLSGSIEEQDEDEKSCCEKYCTLF